MTYDPLLGGLAESTQNEIRIIDRKVIVDQAAKAINIYGLDDKLLALLNLEEPEIRKKLIGLLIICVEFESETVTKKILLAA